MRTSLFILLMFVILGTKANVSKLDTISYQTVIHSKGKLRLEPYLLSFEDTSKKLNIIDIRSGKYDYLFKPYNYEKLSKQNTVFWLKFAIVNKSSFIDQEFVVGTNLFDYIDWYIPNKYKLSTKTSNGNRIKINKLDINKDAGSYASIFIQPHKLLFCYAKVRIIEDIGFQFVSQPPTLYTKTYFDKLTRMQLNWSCIFCGVALIMFIYNLLLLFIVKDKAYFYYIVYNAAMLCFSFALSGSINSIFGVQPFYQNHLIIIFGVFGVSFYTFFSLQIFIIKTHFPKIHRMLQAGSFLLYLGIFFVFSGFIKIAVILCFSIAILNLTTIIIIAFIRVAAGFTPGRYFITANFLYYIGSFFMIGQMLKLLPEEIMELHSYNFYEIGASLELAFFSLALGARINMLRLEISQKKLEQEQILREEERKRSVLILQQNEELEKRIEERTVELSEANNMLNIANETKKKFFSLISHDLRGPAGNIRSLIDIVLTRDLNDPSLPLMLSTIKNQAYANFETIDNLLIWASSQQDQILIKPMLNYIFEIAQNIVNLYGNSADLKNISLENNIEKGLAIVCDANQIKAVLRNLVGNAIKFTDKNGKIEIGSNDYEDYVEIFVKDNGMGMNDKTLNALFRIDVKLASMPGTSNEKGTGLGLIVCREYIEKYHLGKIYATSEEGKGSTFYFRLPKSRDLN